MTTKAAVAAAPTFKLPTLTVTVPLDWLTGCCRLKRRSRRPAGCQ